MIEIRWSEFRFTVPTQIPWCSCSTLPSPMMYLVARPQNITYPPTKIVRFYKQSISRVGQLHSCCPKGRVKIFWSRHLRFTAKPKTICPRGRFILIAKSNSVIGNKKTQIGCIPGTLWWCSSTFEKKIQHTYLLLGGLLSTDR